MLLINKIITGIVESHFVRNMLIMMSGTVIAQAMTVLVSPILTRLFTPAAFGVYGLYASVVSIVVAVVTLRYDQALMLPKRNEEAAALFWASLISALMISFFCLILCLLFFRQILSTATFVNFGKWIFFIPISILLAGFYQTLNSWSTRRKQFHRASISQVIRSFAAVIVQVFSGVTRVGALGLICGSICGDFFSSLTLTVFVKRNDHAILKEGLRWDLIKRLAKQYLDFPLYNSSQGFINALSQNAPLLFLVKFFGPAVAGFYALGVRVLQLPMDLILTSLRQVFFQKANEVYNSGGDTYSLFKKTTFALFAIVILPALAIILFGPVIFKIILGEQWVVAGQYARWLVLWCVCMFLNVPAILFIQIYRKQKMIFSQDVALLIFRIFAIIVGGLKHDPLLAIVLYSLVGVFFNLLIIVLAWDFLRRIKT